MKTMKFTATVGVVEGYHHKNEGTNNALKVVSNLWQEIAKNVLDGCGVYVSAILSTSVTVYHTDWGCPVGGEETVTLVGEANPAFTVDMTAWKEAVIAIVKELKVALKQSTIVVTFSEVDEFVYLTN